MQDRFCPACGSPTRIEEHGGIPRAVCPTCPRILWRNPKAAVAVILQDAAGRVLLVRRSGSRAGTWCIPCGNIEWGEDVREAARRELQEETGFEVETEEVYAVLSNFHDAEAHSVGIWFRGRIVDGRARPGGDASDLGWFDPDRPPTPLAYPTDAVVLEALAAGVGHLLPRPPDRS